MRALSVRQPWAELILRGVKTIEYRSRPTRIVGERFYLYAAKGPFDSLRSLRAGKKAWSRDLAMPGDGPPGWMWELAEQLVLGGGLPTGVIVGSAVIERVTAPAAGRGLYHWHLADVERMAAPRRPVGHPQPVWFWPFGETRNA